MTLSPGNDPANLTCNTGRRPRRPSGCVQGLPRRANFPRLNLRFQPARHLLSCAACRLCAFWWTATACSTSGRQLAPGRPRHTEAARDALVEDAHALPRRHRHADHGGVRRRQARPRAPRRLIRRATSRCFSRANATRPTTSSNGRPQRLIEYGEVLVVTDDYAERDTVAFLGALTSSCAGFIQTPSSPPSAR